MSGDPNPQPAPTSDPAPQPDNNPTPAPAPAVDPPALEPQDVKSLPAWAQKEIKNLREEAASKRTKLADAETAHQALLDNITEALGLKKEDDLAEAAKKAAAERDAAAAESKALKVELAVLKSAAKHGANAEALADSRTFMAKLAGLDPAADDFAAELDTAIKTALEANPSLKVMPDGVPRAPKAQGAPEGGGAPQLKAEDLEHMTPAEINEAREKGQLRDLMTGRNP